MTDMEKRQLLKQRLTIAAMILAGMALTGISFLDSVLSRAV